jgi:hypothetical protein
MLRNSRMWKYARMTWNRLFFSGLLLEYESKREFAKVCHTFWLDISFFSKIHQKFCLEDIYWFVASLLCSSILPCEESCNLGFPHCWPAWSRSFVPPILSLSWGHTSFILSSKAIQLFVAQHLKGLQQCTLHAKQLAFSSTFSHTFPLSLVHPLGSLVSTDLTFIVSRWDAQGHHLL